MNPKALNELAAALKKKQDNAQTKQDAIKAPQVKQVSANVVPIKPPVPPRAVQVKPVVPPRVVQVKPVTVHSVETKPEAVNAGNVYSKEAFDRDLKVQLERKFKSKRGQTDAIQESKDLVLIDSVIRNLDLYENPKFKGELDPYLAELIQKLSIMRKSITEQASKANTRQIAMVKGILGIEVSSYVDYCRTSIAEQKKGLILKVLTHPKVVGFFTHPKVLGGIKKVKNGLSAVKEKIGELKNSLKR